jgi:hypothetical protein
MNDNHGIPKISVFLWPPWSFKKLVYIYDNHEYYISLALRL